MGEEEKTLKATYSDEEIEIILDADRRQVDKFMLHCMNEIKATLIDHTERDDLVLAAINTIGGLDGIKSRAEYVDALIEKAKTRSAMMRKVSESTVTWALIAFLGFLCLATWHEIVAYVKALLAVKS